MIPPDHDEDLPAALPRLPGAAIETVAWLAWCWEAAGGGWAGVPAYVSPHDDVRSFNPREKRWTDDEEDKCLRFTG